MTDWKTLCSELLEAAEDMTVLNDGSAVRFDAVAERVRADLAQSVPPAEGELTDGELNAMWNCSGIADEYGNHTGNIFEFARAAIVLDRTRRALAKSEPAGPSDIELLSMAGNAVGHEIAFGEYEPETECAVEAYGSELIDFARAVLARFGSGPAPVPVVPLDAAQLQFLQDILNQTQDEGPIGAGWASPRLAELRGIVDNWLPTTTLPS